METARPHLEGNRGKGEEIMDTETIKPSARETDGVQSSGRGGLVFISHDSRDAELAEAFTKLLASVSSGLLKSFRSTDSAGKDANAFGSEWFQKLTDRLQQATDVVCLFTERSVDRPWILYEAGIAKGKLNTPVIGIACGIPLDRINTGPFFHFQNCDGSEKGLVDLVKQLAQRISDITLDNDVVVDRVRDFRSKSEDILKKLQGQKKGAEKLPEENPMARLVEEMKSLVRDLPTRVAEQMAEMGDPTRRRRFRRLHPMMIDEMLHMTDDPDDPIGILMVAGLVRDDAPWLYELTMEVYRAAKTGDREAIERELSRLRRFSEVMMRGGPFMEEFGFGGKEAHILYMEFPRMLERVLQRSVESPNREKLRAGRRPKA